MKRVALVVLLAGVAACGLAQSAGSVLLGSGTSGYMNTDVLVEDTATKWTYFSIGGHGGYFLADGFELGPWVNFYLENASNASADTTSSYRYASIGVQAGYFMATGTRFTPFAQLLAAYRMYKDVDTVGGMTISEDSWSAVISQLRLGLEFMLNDSVGLVAGTYLQYYGSGGGASFDLRAFFGLDVFLGPFGRS
jgi:hypothetical protein